MRFAIAILAAALGLAPASAQDMDSFRSPTGNIACSYFEGFLRCDLRSVSNRLPQPPSDCDLDWGKAFEMAFDDRRAARICHGDTVFDPGAPVLGYGDSWAGGGFSCISSERGMSCRNGRGAGWDLSRGQQTLY